MYGSTTHRSIKEVFEDHGKHLVFNKKLVEAITKMSFGFATKNPDHLTFFTGHNIGVETVRFKPEDRNAFFDDLVGMDDIEVRKDILALEKLPSDGRKAPAIVSSRNVSTDAMNLCCLWLVHKFINSKDCTPEEGRQGAIEVLMLLQYKFLTSILAHWLKYPAKPEESEAAYAALSKKFGLKVYGTWGALLRARAEAILGSEFSAGISVISIHSRTIKRFDDDYAIVYMINDIQGRIKDILKNVMDVFMQIHREQIGIVRVTGGTIELDGVSHARELDRMFPTYRRYLYDTVTDKASFIKPELVDIILSAMNTVAKENLVESLEWMSNNFGSPKAKVIDEFFSETMTHLFDWLRKNPDVLARLRDMTMVLSRLKGVYTSNRTTDEAIFKIRATGEEIAERATGIKRQVNLSPIRTGMVMYIVLRTLTMHHYRH